MEKLLFTSVKMKNLGKQGILKPDSEGYYEMPIGAFNCVNSMGEHYTTENLEEVFHSSGELMTKATSGKLFGEWGHPTKQPGESVQEFINRACRVEDKHTCVFFKDVWLEKKVSPAMIKCGIPEDAVITMARLKPHGILWETLDRSLKDPNVNTAFSGRFMTRDRLWRGQTYVIVERAVTWDAVTAQGIQAAEKAFAPRLESYKQPITPETIKGLKLQLDSGVVRLEHASELRQIVRTADKFFQTRTGRQIGYMNW